MGKNMSFGIGYDDEKYLRKAQALFPKMKFSRLLHMIIREWLDFKEKQNKPMSVEDALELLQKYIKAVNKTHQTARSLNDFV